jgi:nucleoside-diphosphate-sugar epimerase
MLHDAGRAFAREKLGGWEATTTLEEGLEKTIDYFRRTYDL